jgi:hypothetical protein
MKNKEVTAPKIFHNTLSLRCPFSVKIDKTVLYSTDISRWIFKFAKPFNLFSPMVFLR